MAFAGAEQSDFKDILKDSGAKEEQRSQGQLCFFHLYNPLRGQVHSMGSLVVDPRSGDASGALKKEIKSCRLCQMQ